MEFNVQSPQQKKLTRSKLSFGVILKILIILELVIMSPYLVMNIITFGFVRNNDPNTKVALILGAGLNNKKPSAILELRLDAAARLYKNGLVNTMLVSGTNTSIYYNEPVAMKLYLIDEWKVKAEDIIMDFGGRRTIDSCWRAKNVFKIQSLYVVTQAYHLSRSYYLCTQSGLETIPVIARDTRYGIERDGFFREIPATWEALKNINNITIDDEYVPVIKGDGSEQNLRNR